MLQNLLTQIFRMRRSDACIDIKSIRLGAYGNDVRSKLAEYVRRKLISRAVRAVEDDF
ncbi:hypothetical protein D3C84_1288020 [compost metagenome]